jgi:hypothetical protein
VKVKSTKVRTIEVGVREGELDRVALCSGVGSLGDVQEIRGRYVELPFG